MTSQLNTQSVIFEQPTTHKVEGPKGFSPIRLALQLYGRMSPEKAGRLVNRMACHRRSNTDPLAPT